MKEESLMIGDIFLYRDSEDTIIVLVVKFDSGVVRLKRSDGHVFNVAIEFLQPAPIVPDFLKMIGFEERSDGWLFALEEGAEDKNHILVQFDDESDKVRYIEIFVADKADIRARNIQYIHEFQHALQLCEISKLFNK